MPHKTTEQLVKEFEEAIRRVAKLKHETDKLDITNFQIQQEDMTGKSNFYEAMDHGPACDNESPHAESGHTINVESLRSLMDDFSKLTNIGIGIVDTKGNVLVRNEWQEICSKFHRAHHEARANCLESYLCSTRDMKEGEHRLYKCKNNMWNLISPIFINRGHVANIFLGQFLFEDDTPDMEVFISQAEKFGFEKDQYLSALKRAPRWSQEKLNTVINLYSKLVSTIANLSHANLLLTKTIEEHRLTLEALGESEDKFEKVFRCAPVMITLSDLENGMYSEVNDKFVEITGYNREEAIGKSSLELGVISAEERSNWIQELTSTGRVSEKELSIFTKSKSEVHCIGSCAIIQTRKGLQLLALGYDITDRIRAEQEKEVYRAQLLQAQKMEAVGNLAGGIAHDFNNLLQVIIGYSEMVLQSKQGGEPDYSNVRQIYDAGKSGAKLIRNLMMFSRKSENKPRPINLNDQIRQLEKMLARTIPQTITIRTILDPGILLTNADPTQIDQVIMNLTVNAKDAMGDEGKLILKTENVTLDQEFCNTHVGVKPGSYVRLTFSDSGSGISQETLSHIFEPFFTTKSVGKGTGLGLSTVYSIVKQHHGSIDCESKIGHGTTFKIYLPAIAPTLNEI